MDEADAEETGLGQELKEKEEEEEDMDAGHEDVVPKKPDIFLFFSFFLRSLKNSKRNNARCSGQGGMV